jgi:hypothetical protein
VYVSGVGTRGRPLNRQQHTTLKGRFPTIIRTSAVVATHRHGIRNKPTAPYIISSTSSLAKGLLEMAIHHPRALGVVMEQVIVGQKTGASGWVRARAQVPCSSHLTSCSTARDASALVFAYYKRATLWLTCVEFVISSTSYGAPAF